MRSSLTIPVAIIAGGIIVAGAVYVSSSRSKEAGGNPALVRPVSAADHIFGNPAARVMIVEYSDFDCEYCREFETILHQIVATDTENVALVYRHFPLTELHPNAFSHARAAECAASVGGNEGFWKFAETLFASQPLDTTRYGAIAAGAGLNGDAFATCYATASTTIDSRIRTDRENALEMGAQGAPYSVILRNGMAPIVINGTYPYDTIKQLVDQALIK